MIKTIRSLSLVFLSLVLLISLLAANPASAEQTQCKALAGTNVYIGNDITLKAGDYDYKGKVIGYSIANRIEYVVINTSEGIAIIPIPSITKVSEVRE